MALALPLLQTLTFSADEEVLVRVHVRVRVRANLLRRQEVRADACNPM